MMAVDTSKGGCSHPDMKKQLQYVAAHDKAMRMLIQTCIKCNKGGFYLIADEGRVEGLKEIGVHNKRVPAFVLPDSYIQVKDIGAEDGRAFLTHRGPDSRNKMMPEAEQKVYLPHSQNSGHPLSSLSPGMPSGKVSIKKEVTAQTPGTHWLKKLAEKGSTTHGFGGSFVELWL